MDNLRKFKVGDWVRIKSGPNKGLTFTIVFISKIGCTGYLCGKVVSASWEDVIEY